MKKSLKFILLYSLTVLAYAQTCPELPGGYNFSLAGWGNHVSTKDQVRCHYYYYNDIHKHKVVAVGMVDESHIKKYSQWINSGDHYYLCNSRYNNVNDCPF